MTTKPKRQCSDCRWSRPNPDHETNLCCAHVDSLGNVPPDYDCNCFEPRNELRRCEWCRFFNPKRKSSGGFCQAVSPLRIGDPDNLGVMMVDDWCGEFDLS